MSSVLDDVADLIEPAPDIVSIMAATKPPLVLSIDVGTSGVRVALFDEGGNEIPDGQARSRRASPPLSDFGELDADAIVAEVIDITDQLFAATVRSVGKIELIAISTFWHSLIGVDDDGRASTPLLTWADTRGAEQVTFLRRDYDETELHQRTGCRFHPSYWPAKLLWLKQERADQFAATRQWLGFAEYLCRRLFGVTTCSVSMASATGIFNQRVCDWDWDFASALGIPAETLPEISDNRMARLLDAFANRWPALAEARLAAVIGDGAANNIGGGCSSRDKLALMVGTSGAMRVVFVDEPPADLAPALWSYRVNRTRIVVGGALSDGGGLFRWLTETMNVDSSLENLQKELADLEPDAHGLTVLPFWSGERSTGWSASARGGILGLRQQTSPVEIIRASLEAIAYRFALIARALESVAPAASVIATGNALRSSPVWLQIIADVLGRPVMFGGSPEASIRGAALLALEAVGKIGNIEDVAVSIDEVFEPNLERHARYQQGLERQEELYHRLLL
jgi:gluconokinase